MVWQMQKFANFPKRRVLAFGDSNTYGYNPETDGRYGDDERFACRMQAALGNGWTVIEEGLPGRTAVFDDPMNEGLCGLDLIAPLMLSHAPLDTVLIMLGTNDSKARFGCGSYLIARGLVRLARKACQTQDAWRTQPDVLLVCPAPIRPEYAQRMFAEQMGPGCDVRAAGLADALEPMAREAGLRFFDAGRVPGVEVHPLDGMHLTREAHAALADALVKELIR